MLGGRCTGIRTSSSRSRKPNDNIFVLRTEMRSSKVHSAVGLLLIERETASNKRHMTLDVWRLTVSYRNYRAEEGGTGNQRVKDT